MTPQNVLLFSGGRTSGMMLRMMIDSVSDFRERFITVFCNTGKEMPQTLDFVHAVETIWEVPIVWLEYTRVPATSIPVGIFPTPRRNHNLARAAANGESVHWFNIVNYETASRNGRPFDELLEWASVLPNVRSRLCSVQLKIRSAMRYLFSLGVKEYAPHIGIRKDEAHRAVEILASADSFEHCRFPLIEAGKTEPDVMGFWKLQPFDLQLQSYQGNCDLCFLKAKHKRVRIARENPERVHWWKDWERVRGLTTNGDGGYFRRGEPYSEIERIANLPPEPSLFDWADSDISCTCVERAFEPDDTI